MGHGTDGEKCINHNDLSLANLYRGYQVFLGPLPTTYEFVATCLRAATCHDKLPN